MNTLFDLTAAVVILKNPPGFLPEQLIERIEQYNFRYAVKISHLPLIIHFLPPHVKRIHDDLVLASTEINFPSMFLDAKMKLLRWSIENSFVLTRYVIGKFQIDRFDFSFDFNKAPYSVAGMNDALVRLNSETMRYYALTRNCINGDVHLFKKNVQLFGFVRDLNMLRDSAKICYTNILAYNFSDTPNDNICCLLMCAFRSGNIEMVKYIENTFPFANIPQYSHIIFENACKSGNVEVARYYMSNYACFNSNPSHFLKFACFSENLEMVQWVHDQFNGEFDFSWLKELRLTQEIFLYLVEKYAHILLYRYVVYIMARNFSDDVVRQFLRHENAKSLLKYAFEHNRVAVLPPNLSWDEIQDIAVIVTGANVSMLQYLREKIDKPTCNEFLWWASIRGDLDAVEYLVENICTHYRDVFGCHKFAHNFIQKFFHRKKNVLCTASANGHLDVVRYIIYKFYDKMKKKHFNDAFLEACSGGYVHLIKFYVDNYRDKLSIDKNAFLRVKNASNNVQAMMYFKNVLKVKTGLKNGADFWKFAKINA
jgi:hypothetical protein